MLTTGFEYSKGIGVDDQPRARSIRCADTIWGKLKILSSARREKMSLTLAYLVAAEWERLQSNNREDKGGQIIWPMSEQEKHGRRNSKAKTSRRT